jgi:hypothetical protein
MHALESSGVDRSSCLKAGTNSRHWANERLMLTADNIVGLSISVSEPGVAANDLSSPPSRTQTAESTATERHMAPANPIGTVCIVHLHASTGEFSPHDLSFLVGARCTVRLVLH